MSITKKLLILLGIIVIILIIFFSVRYYMKKKAAQASTNLPNANITSVSPIGTAENTQEQALNLQNAGKKVKAKNLLSSYNFNTYVQGYLPSYAKSNNAADIQNNGSILGDYSESFNAYDVDKLYDLTATKLAQVNPVFNKASWLYRLKNAFGGGQGMSDMMVKGLLYSPGAVQDFPNHYILYGSNSHNGEPLDISSAKMILFKVSTTAGDKFYRQTDVTTF